MSQNVIKFGTDGWRSLVAEDFTLPNVRAVTQAVAEYLLAHPERSRRKAVLVGYDTRPMGDRFAEAVAEVFAGNGFEVLLTDGPMPTPAISFAIRKYRLQGGVAVTASHNPFTYNGLKFKPSYAGPAEPEMTRWIEGRLFRRPSARLDFELALKQKKIKLLDLEKIYLSFLKSYVRWDLISRKHVKVAYDSMHGAGQELLQKLAQGTRIEVFPIRKPGLVPSHHRPEPVGDHLKELCATVRKEKCDLGLATDGDADRVGLVGPDGKFISSQETMSLLVWHMLEDLKMRGKVVSTVSGTNLLDRLTASYGVPFERTPVGFKHIAALMRSEKVLVGGEESGGFGFHGCPPERDGLLGGLLILQMIAMRKQSLSQILKQMRKKFGYWIFKRADLELSAPLKMERLNAWAANGTAHRLQVEGVPVRKILTVDGVKLIFEDDSWMLLRPSGTEPLLRVYAEAATQKQLEGLLKAGQSIGRQVARA